ncbi:putative transporter B0285.6 [Caenorhabditis elegans]|uniref:Uncharacterized transporter B0285.6 n=1 Tax=Caenorhabditis elegans TaxID=6239 RepID=YKG6_CAEEL|nr:putative transporter B0285.6 [Caenorhabditis elegans]P46556.3 RecName: Full=Uncharacterized transporter B0285.6 [Caenorhabditis elegans]CAA84299.3 Uncharacterized transporter B0285.6 [Caenorhabditis elegans]
MGRRHGWADEFRTFFPTLWLILAPLILSPLLFFGQEGKCAFVILTMSCYWVAEVVPLAVTSFIPMIALPFLGIVSIKEVAPKYFADTNIVFFNSLMLSLAVEECQLHKRIALKMLTYVGTRPHWLMAGFMIITSFISLWISDTACCALMAPIAYALLEEIMIPKMRPEEKENEIEVMKIFDKEDPEEKEKKKLDTSRLSVRDRGICKCMMLLVAHASLIGGTGTINSTGPNLIFRDNIEKNFPNEDHGISYLSWMAFAIPPMIFYMFSSWFIVQLQFLGPRHLMGMFREPTETEKQEEEVAKRAVWKSYDQLGPMTWAEKSTLVIFVLAVLSWVSSDPKVIPGWSDLFRKGYVTDSCSGLVAVFLLFIWPKKKPDFRIFRKDKSRPSVRQEPLIDWDCVRRRFPWSIILLLGAGFAISDAVRVSGLSSLIACSLNSTISKMPFFVMQIILSIVVVVMTEFSTNSATASIFIPISFKMAEAVGAHPLYFSIPTAIGPSFSFMLPMATPANAIVYETKTIRMIDMVSCGVFLNIFCIAITAINMNTWAFWLFNMGTYPDYALRHATNMTGNSSQCF